MKLFPTISKQFKLLDSKSDTILRFKRRTEYSKNLTSQYTDKSFRGHVEENHFKVISSKIGRGAFCIMTGKIEENNGFVNLEIHMVFKILSSILLLFPFAGLIITIVQEGELHPMFIIVLILQLIIIRFGFIGLAFKYLGKESLNRFRDVLDIEWTD